MEEKRKQILKQNYNPQGIIILTILFGFSIYIIFFVFFRIKSPIYFLPATIIYTYINSLSIMRLYKYNKKSHKYLKIMTFYYTIYKRAY